MPPQSLRFFKYLKPASEQMLRAQPTEDPRDGVGSAEDRRALRRHNGGVGRRCARLPPPSRTRARRSCSRPPPTAASPTARRATASSPRTRTWSATPPTSPTPRTSSRATPTAPPTSSSCTAPRRWTRPAGRRRPGTPGPPSSSRPGWAARPPTALRPRPTSTAISTTCPTAWPSSRPPTTSSEATPTACPTRSSRTSTPARSSACRSTRRAGLHHHGRQFVTPGRQWRARRLRAPVLRHAGPGPVQRAADEHAPGAGHSLGAGRQRPLRPAVGQRLGPLGRVPHPGHRPARRRRQRRGRHRPGRHDRRAPVAGPGVGVGGHRSGQRPLG
jgi:hypothetical protein